MAAGPVAPAHLLGADPELSVLYANLKRCFREAKLATPDLDARLLITETLEVSTAQLVANPRLFVPDDRIAELERRTRQRLSGCSVGRILGRRAFWSLDLRLNADTLEPRPETEAVVELALSLLSAEEPSTIADLGVGTGAILLALLSERPHAFGVGIDIAHGALAEARRNAERHGLTARCAFARGNFAAPLAQAFDLVVSNPPYICSGVISSLDPSVRDHDPQLALDGGADGLDCYRTLFAQGMAVLRPGAALVIEIDPAAFDAVVLEAARSALEPVAVANDLSGAARAIALRGGSV